MIIINLMPFVKTKLGHIGLAAPYTFAASAWIVSDDLYKTTGGIKFSWIGPDGKEYTEDKRIMERPTEEEVLAGMSSVIKLLALAKGYIKEET